MHMEKGGPRLCLSCCVEIRKKASEPDPFLKMLNRGLGSDKYAGAGELTLELLVAAIALTHPDVHPPERAKAAHRVTAELTALKPHTNPEAPPPDPNLKPSAPPRPAVSFPKPAYPCEDCEGMQSYYYCDACKGKWEEARRAEREPINAKARHWRAVRRAMRRATCPICGAEFRGKRRDAATCSPACRQKAYRRRKAAPVS
jgi:hypothetical protein